MLFGKCVNSVYIKESESEVAQSCLTLCDPVDCSLPGSSLHGILQARVLEWGAIAFSRGSSWPRDWTRVSCIPGRCFNLWATREGQFTLRHLPVLALSWLPIVITWRLQVIRFPSHLPNVVTETLFLSNLKMKTLVFEWFFFFFTALSFSVPSEAAILPSGSGIPHPSRRLHSSTFLPPAPSLAKLCLQWAHSARW